MPQTRRRTAVQQTLPHRHDLLFFDPRKDVLGMMLRALRGRPLRMASSTETDAPTQATGPAPA